MSSILTNNGAMVALQTLKSINSRLADTQSEISTGKSVASARDNAAVWAISKVMEADVKGFKGISDSLNLGESTVAVARQAAETVTDLLTEMKGKIVAAQEENVDRAKIQNDINALRDQIGSVTGAAQFNGLNLISNLSSTAGTGSINILSSLDRSGTGVSSSDITVGKQDLSTQQAALTGTWTATAGDSGTLNGTQTDTLTIAAPTAAGAVYGLSVFGTDADNSTFTQADYRSSAALTPANAAELGQILYVTKDGDTAADVAKGLAQAYAIYAAENNLDTDVLNITQNGSGLNISSTVTDATDSIQVQVNTGVAGAGASATIGGGLGAVADIDVTTDAGADSALVAIEFMIQNSIDAAAEFGSVQGRIETQTNFITGMTDALKSGIGTLVDADMEEASARLQALQVQQQLGVQALSIANQAPQSLLSLFR
ncbi:flagellin [Thalassococcus sp. CAU 1522]|uniref:Flagellin n=1 Tax=Thalassococcus arenae TaxID=2851652 RepID=A0ABS6N5Q0_9RHOB|nr:flagellin [Thalassococcus arenae]MBV2359326.1 flagellin [Thalassococcus arenae]